MKNWPRSIGALLVVAGVLTVLAGLALASGDGARAQQLPTCDDLSTACTELSQAATYGDSAIMVNSTSGFAQGASICVDGNADTDCNDSGEEPNDVVSVLTGELGLETSLANDHSVGALIMVIPCVQVTPTPTPEATETPTPEATETPTPEATETPTPEATETPTPEATETPTPEATETPTKTATPAATPTPVKTATPVATPVATAIPATATPAAPPPTGMGSGSDGGSAAVYALLALGGLLALAGAALTWRFRPSKV